MWVGKAEFPPKVASTSEAATEPTKKGNCSAKLGGSCAGRDPESASRGERGGCWEKKQPPGNSLGPGGNWKLSVMPAGRLWG